MREMADSLLSAGRSNFTREEALAWFREHYPKIKVGTVSAHLIRLSTNNRTRLHYHARPDEDDQFFQEQSGLFRRHNTTTDPTPIRQDNSSADSDSILADSASDVPVASQNGNASEFAYEHDLRDYLARSLHLIEPGLRLFDDEGVTGVEFPAGGRFIDILAVDSRGNYVVIELKVSKGYDRVVGQLLRYMGWIETNQADEGQSVRGVIVAKSVSDDLRLACRRVTGISLFEYTLSVTLSPVTFDVGAHGV